MLSTPRVSTYYGVTYDDALDTQSRTGDTVVQNSTLCGFRTLTMTVCDF